MQAAIAAERVCVARGPAARPTAQPRGLPAAAAAPKVIARSSVLARAATEEVKTAGTNGAPLKPATAAMDFDELTELIKMVHSTDIVELELNSKKFRLSVKKKEALEAAEPQIIHMQAPAAGYAAAPQPMAMPAPAPAPAAAPAAPAPAAAAPKPAAPAAVDGLEVVSPMAGTLYRSPAPGEPAFVKEGDSVTKGQVICIVEGEPWQPGAETSGTVVKILASDGDAVLPGQPLMVIRP
ncbi:hypothetical protein CHLNCDRAFT_142410 [Chlorella variabilis]|uniref:Biotin carboxyl carrier protein of acetyl-CoA carboxylase n=1 Tax=Chlorella variabilis TaxID=554065 RepID=E1Z723_CHLVA|nr:hypothetical protein CHLNCDRAFT_142410 [Chlorella variabilis]EFN58349.1 hypothetical protein CHLNCDRAFT_142410 [Chlorella variabilis]|eukprot:XP_005850451.1 hypothetical protein CHLNCDRAFT_142410 [Chlorella variabilis]